MRALERYHMAQMLKIFQSYEEDTNMYIQINISFMRSDELYVLINKGE